MRILYDFQDLKIRHGITEVTKLTYTALSMFYNVNKKTVALWETNDRVPTKYMDGTYSVNKK